MIEVVIGPGLRDLAAVIEPEFYYAEDLIGSLLRDIWKDKALETRSYLSGDYYRNIHTANAILSGALRTIDTISDVGYGDIIETIGWSTQPARFPAEKALERADPDIEKILTDAAERAIDRIENG